MGADSVCREVSGRIILHIRRPGTSLGSPSSGQRRSPPQEAVFDFQASFNVIGLHKGRLKRCSR